MKKYFIIVGFLTLLLSNLCVGFAQDEEDTYVYKHVCPGGDYVYDDCSKNENTFPCDLKLSYFIDKWKFAQCNCTSYAAHKVNELFEIWDINLLFNNSFQGVSWSNGAGWDNAADRVGIPVGDTPLPGDVAYWDGDYGHVAYTERSIFNPDVEITNSLTGIIHETKISDYNWEPSYGGEHSIRTIDVNEPDGYIHMLLHVLGAYEYILALEMSLASGPPFSNCDDNGCTDIYTAEQRGYFIWIVGTYYSHIGTTDQEQEIIAAMIEGFPIGGMGGEGSQELPDLETELTVENSAGHIITTAQPGDQIRIVSRPEVKHADAENGNTKGREKISVYFYIDGVFLKEEETRVEHLQEGSDHEEYVEYTIPAELPDGKVITFTNIIDAEEEIEETNEGDNESLYQITIRRLTKIEQEIEKHELTQITLPPGQIIYIQIADNKEGPKIIDGVTYWNDVYKATEPGMPRTGTLFKIHEKGNNLYAFYCLGHIDGNKWLAGSPDTLDTFLAQHSNEDHHETYWAIYQDPQGKKLLRNMKQGTNPNLDGFVWFDGRTEANNPYLVENLDYTGTRLNITPVEIHWSYADPYGPPNHHCERWNEIADHHTWWDNYLCSNVNLNMSWSYAGSLPNKRCTHLYEPADLAGTWNDNYICVEHHNPIHFYWSSHNPVPGIRNCTKIEEPAERVWTNTWDDNWLCWE